MFIMPFIIAFTLNILFIALPHSYTYNPPSFPLLIRRLITVVSFPLFRTGIPSFIPFLLISIASAIGPLTG